MKNQVVVISNMDNNTYFFSKDHYQNLLSYEENLKNFENSLVD